MGGASDVFKASSLERPSQRLQIANSKFDLNFLSHAEILAADDEIRLA
jgi:hypothetical protein